MRARRLLFGCALLLLPPLATSLRRLTSLRTGERLRGVVVGAPRDKLVLDLGRRSCADSVARAVARCAE